MAAVCGCFDVAREVNPIAQRTLHARRAGCALASFNSTATTVRKETRRESCHICAASPARSGNGRTNRWEDQQQMTPEEYDATAPGAATKLFIIPWKSTTGVTGPASLPVVFTACP